MLHNTPTIPMESITGPSAGFLDKTQLSTSDEWILLACFLDYFLCPLNTSKLKAYRGVNIGLYVLLSSTQVGPGRTVKQEQEEISHNHVQTFIYLSVITCCWSPA